MNVAAGRLPEDVYTNTLPSWRVALRREFVAVVERESKVIAEWQVRSFFFFFLFSLSTPLSSRLPPACCVGEGTGWVERERGKVHVVVDLQARVRSPRLDTFFQQTSMQHLLMRLCILWTTGLVECEEDMGHVPDVSLGVHYLCQICHLHRWDPLHL